MQSEKEVITVGGRRVSRRRKSIRFTANDKENSHVRRSNIFPDETSQFFAANEESTMLADVRINRSPDFKNNIVKDSNTTQSNLDSAESN